MLNNAAKTWHTFNGGILTCVWKGSVGWTVQLEALVTVAASAIDLWVQGWALREGALSIGDTTGFVEASHAPVLSSRSNGKPGALELAVPSWAACPQLRAVLLRAQYDPRSGCTSQRPNPRFIWCFEVRQGHRSCRGACWCRCLGHYRIQEVRWERRESGDTFNGAGERVEAVR